MKQLAILTFITWQIILNAAAQDTMSVLFLGNSYTSYNNLPELVQQLSTSAGKTLIIDSNMPGGMTISGHLNDATTYTKISQGTWDFVVIQEQSQIPTIDFFRYNDMYPALTDMKGLIEQFNSCTKVMTYMTWGRRYGGQQCDPSNTYCSPEFTDFNHMQDSLTSAYTQISEQLNIQCAPVGVTWQNILNDTTLVLHSPDNSHPNSDGSYVAALTIFSALWQIPSEGNTFNAGLPQSRAQYYQQMSDNTIFDNDSDWNLTINDPIADFSYLTFNNNVTFTNSSETVSNNTPVYHWDFGDGNTSDLQNPNHIYSSPGSFTVSLIVADCIFSDTISYELEILSTGLNEQSTGCFHVYPNPFRDELSIISDIKCPGFDYLISDLTGKTIQKGSLAHPGVTIHLGESPDGFYMLHYGLNLEHKIKLLKSSQRQ